VTKRVDWRLLGDASHRYVEPEEDLGEGGGRSESWIIEGTCFVIFSGSLYERILKDFPEFKPNPEWPFRRMPLATSANGISIHFPLYGSPRAANSVEQLSKAGASRLIGLGFCGSLHSSLTIGSIMAPTGCVRGDAVSLHYAPVEFPAVPDFDLLSDCLGAIQNGTHIRKGVQYSTDALYRETHEQILFWHHCGVLSIDMECSAFLTISHNLGVQACWLGVVSDYLENGQHVGSISGVDVMETATALFKDILNSRPGL